MLKPELGSECQLVPLVLPALPVLPAGLCSECRVVFLRGADDVTLVLQQLQHLLQHGFTQAWAEAQAGTGQDVQEVAALLHVCGKKGVGAAWTHPSDPLLSPHPPVLSSTWKSFSIFPESEPAASQDLPTRPDGSVHTEAGDALAYLTEDNKPNHLCSGVCEGPLLGDTGLQPPGFPISNCVLITPWGCSA